MATDIEVSDASLHPAIAPCRALRAQRQGGRRHRRRVVALAKYGVIDVRSKIIIDAGHLTADERPAEVWAAIAAFRAAA